MTRPNDDECAIPPPPAETGSRLAALIVTGTFVALLFLPGVYHLAFGLDREDVHRWTSWLGSEPPAEAVKKIEQDLDQRFVLAQVTRTLARGVPVPALDLSPNGDVVPGVDGFRFYGVDVQVTRNAGFLDPRLDRGRRAADAIVDLAAQLQRRGIHLLVVPVPAKSSIYPERLNPKYDVALGPEVNVHHAGWVQKLRDGGVDVLDLTELYWSKRYADGSTDAGALLYPATDTHWSARGMRLAAEQIAARVRPNLVGVPPAPPFKTRPRLRFERGDLSLLQEGEQPSNAPATFVREEQRQLYDDHGPVIPGDEAPVLVIGDSYAALHVDDGCGLSQQTMAELNIPVQSAAVIGAKGDTMRRVLYTRPQLLKNKRVVVLAFTIRLLVCCDWTPIPLGDMAGE